jgi:hypothetical protein
MPYFFYAHFTLDTHCMLTLIVQGEVKIDLANFDVKYWTKCLCFG